MKNFYRLLLLVLVAPVAGRASGSEASVTFNKDVAPILFDHCAACHRPGQVGPFSLLTFDDARKRAKQIATVTTRKIMPPWKPVGQHGEFRDERTLTDEQIAVFKAWTDAGLPEGRAEDLPARPKFPDGWQLGTPDVVLKMPQPYKVPAVGDDVYMHFVFPLEIDNIKYLRGLEVLPSNRRVAHHAVGILDNSGTARKLAAENGGVGYSRLGGPGFLPAGFTPGYVPGQINRFFPEDTAITIKKGTDLVLQMHYHPTGKEETDQTVVGLYFAEKPPARNMGALLLGSEDVDIPAGAKTHLISDAFQLPADYEFRSVWAHMHLIGKTVHVWAELPDGKSKQLLKIDDWDFNWQDTYSFAQPFVLPKGTILKAEFHYDNSADNPRNPFSPP